MISKSVDKPNGVEAIDAQNKISLIGTFKDDKEIMCTDEKKTGFSEVSSTPGAYCIRVAIAFL